MATAKGTELVQVDQSALIPVMDAELAEIIRDNMGNGEFNIFNLPRVRIPAGGGLGWMVDSIDGVSQEPEIQGIIIKWASWRGYWPGDFSGKGTPPQCSSPDAIIGVGDPGGECKRCPLNAFGTKGRSKACKEMRAVFVLREGDIFPHLMILPITSAIEMQKVMMAMAQRRLPYWQVPMTFKLQQAQNADRITYSLVKVQVHESLKLEGDNLANLRSYRNEILPTLERQSVEFVQSGETETDLEMPFE